ncbi:MAG: DUF4382 domain-containing protein [Deltaproteobacteria bacterium]|nr:DUF4382 domain-containing protein [Deltaproteobacteria bacterium]
MNTFRFLGLSVLIVLGFVLSVSCGDDDDDDSGGGSAAFSLYMIDAPVDEADEINMTVAGVSVNGPDGWTDLAVTPARYNLLELMNNAGVTLAEQDLPEGDYGEIRLVIECEGDEAPEIVIEGESYPLTVPSGCTSGFKLKGEFTVAAGAETVLIMDFDMSKSVHQTGNGKYMLKPVVRFVQADAAGNIIGEVTPVVSRTVVYAFNADDFSGDNFDDAVNSTIIRDDGSFTLAALPAGTYDIVVAAPGYEAAVYREDIVVEAGSDTVLDEPIELLEP